MSEPAESTNGHADRFARLYRALEEQDLDAVVELLDPAVEVTSLKGTFTGRDAVRRWATRSNEGSLYGRMEIDDVREIGDEYLAVGARKLWYWREDDTLGGEFPFGTLLRFRDGRIVSWRQDFPSIVEALESIPVHARE